MKSKAIKPRPVSKYKQKFEQRYDADNPLSSEQSSKDEDKKWGVTRDNASIGINFIMPNDRQGFPYTYLQRWRITVTGEIHLKYSEGLIIISGQNLQPLYQDICRYRLYEIAVDEYANGTIIDEINIKLNDEALT